MTIQTIHSSRRLLLIAALFGAPLWGQSGQDAASKPVLRQQASLTADIAKDSVPAANPASDPDKTPVPVTITASAADSNFVIGNEDILAISVWKDTELSRVIPVRSDGKISLPLIGELRASGKTPRQLQAEITGGLQSYMSNPQVTVIVQEIKSLRFNILGHVQKPGSYMLTPPMTLVDAIALAGGLGAFANAKSIYVLRDDGGKQVRLPFNYKKVIKGSHPEQNIQLQPRDTVVVP
jgi:polysaccharide biosynthesis/export protein